MPLFLVFLLLTLKTLKKFLEDLNKFHPNLRFTNEKSREKINFLDVVIKLKRVKLPSIFFASLQMVINIFIMIPVMQNT